MTAHFDIFFSNRLEYLYQKLKKNLFFSSSVSSKTPFPKRLVVVYGPAMKNWLMMRMAKDVDLAISTGIEYIYLSQVFGYLMNLSSEKQMTHFPSKLDLALAIESELMQVLNSQNEMDIEECEGWSTLFRYLKWGAFDKNFSTKFCKKRQRRLNSLSLELASLFSEYGRFGGEMVQAWEIEKDSCWQARLWRRIFESRPQWTYPAKALGVSHSISSGFTLHFFSISFITQAEFAFLNKLSSTMSIYYYLLSPCAMFWGDIRSDKESAALQKYWKNKGLKNTPQYAELEEFLRDRNPLLANFGRMGREMANQIENASIQAKAQYVLPSQVRDLNEDLEWIDDLYFEETGNSQTLLSAIQADLISLRNPQENAPLNFLDEKGSIQIHIATNRRREIQVLYHNLMGLLAKDSQLSALDVIVLAPDIEEYVPYIQSLFGSADSQLDYQILDLGMQVHSGITQGFLQLLNLAEGRWNASAILQLFENASFQRRHQLTAHDCQIIQEWIDKAGILWGEDWFHRNELLLRSYCEKEMVEKSSIGTWNGGVERLLTGLTSETEFTDTQENDTADSIPIDFAESELLGRWVQLIHALRQDVAPLCDGSKMTIQDWADFLDCLLENYFAADAQSLSEFEQLKTYIETLKSSSIHLKDALFTFLTIKSHLTSLCQQKNAVYREDHFHAVRFCSLIPLRSIPAKVVVLMGMQEGNFPRVKDISSLNEMNKHKNCHYVPSITDYDRYLFLEALHAAQEYLWISYLGYQVEDNKEQRPSLVVEELISYLDKHFIVSNQKFSELFIYRHPIDSYDPSYFYQDSLLYNFSQSDYEASCIHLKALKAKSYRFLSSFSLDTDAPNEFIGQQSVVDLKNLVALARNPIKFHLEKGLGIYLQSHKDRELKVEEPFVLSHLDRYKFKEASFQSSIDTVLSKAEKCGALPLGLFKDVAKKRLVDDIQNVHLQLKKYAIEKEMIFEIEFDVSCCAPMRVKNNSWIFPACLLTLSNNKRIAIVGKLKYATSEGIFSIAKGTLSEAWKMWPQFLLYCFAAKLKPDLLKPQLILAESAKPFPAFFDDPEHHLINFIEYYEASLKKISPLLPDWMAIIVKGDAHALEDKMRQIFVDGFGGFVGEELKWVFNKHHLPCPIELITNWNEVACHLTGDLIRHWFPAKEEKEVYETI